MVKEDEQTIQKRRLALQHYYKRVLRSVNASNCSIVADFLTEGAKGMRKDPTREPSQRMKRTKSVTPDREITGRKKKAKVNRRSTTTSRSRSSGDLDTSTIALLKHAKESKPPASTLSSSVNSNSWVMVKPRPVNGSPQNPLLSRVNTLEAGPTRAKMAPLMRQNRTTFVGPIPSVSEMFSTAMDNDSSQDEVSDGPFVTAPTGPTRAPKQAFMMRRASTMFYHKKLQKMDPLAVDAVLEESEDSSSEKDETANLLYTQKVMAEENINELSFITAAELASLGLEDVDLAEFDLAEMHEMSECTNVDQLLHQLGDEYLI